MKQSNDVQEARGQDHAPTTDAELRRLLQDCEQRMEQEPAEAERLCSTALAAARTLDSTELLAESLHLYGQCCWHLFRYTDALAAYNEAYPIFRHAGRQKRLAEVLLFRGHIYHRLGRFEAALSDYKNSYDIYEEQGAESGKADALIGMGLVYWMLDDYDNAIDYYMQSLGLYKELGDIQGEADCRNNIGIIYRMMGDYHAALLSIKESYALFQKLESRHGLAEALGNLGVVYFEMRRYNETLDAFSQCLELFQQTANKYGLAGILNNIGMVWARLGQPRKARDFYHKGLAIAREIESKDREVEALTSLGRLETELQEYPEALKHFKAGLELAERMKLKSQAYLLHKFLSACYEQKGDLAHAIEHLKRHQKVKEDVFNESSDRKLKNLQILYQVEHAENTAEIYRLKNVELAGALKSLEAGNRHLQELNREKNEILGIAAHDLKNPLNSIMMLARHIAQRETAAGDPEIQETSQDILKTARRMFDLVSNLLNLHAIEEGRIHLQTGDVNLALSLSYVVDSYRDAASAKDIDLHYSAPAEALHVLADSNALVQVLDNLVSNAVKYTVPGGNVRIELERRPDTACCCIRDEGPGISADDQKKLFGKFMRLSARPTGGEHSTGLGLSIVKKLMEAMQGRVWCESSPGSGAAFFAEFPLAEAGQQH